MCVVHTGKSTIVTWDLTKYRLPLLRFVASRYRSRYSLHGVTFLYESILVIRFSFRNLNISSSAASLFLIIPLIVNRRSQEVRGVDQAFGSFMRVVYMCTYVCMCVQHAYMRSCVGRRV